MEADGQPSKRHPSFSGGAAKLTGSGPSR